MVSYIMVSLKILFITTLLSLFTYFFGWQSFKLYAEHNVMFMDERTDVDKDKPPALMIAYAPAKGSTINGEIVRSNEEVIKSCLQRNESKNMKGYKEGVDCIDKNLKDKVGIFRDHETSQKSFCSQTQIQKGWCS